MDDSLIFFDRNGREHYCENSIPSEKRGFFLLILKEGKILLTLPPRSNMAEFPGGSQRRGENFRDCVSRKLYEETGIDFVLDQGIKTFEQTVRYFADDERPDGGFYYYHQTFVVYEADSFVFDTSDARWKTPENGWAFWVKIDDLLSQKIMINYVHRPALSVLLG